MPYRLHEQILLAGQFLSKCICHVKIDIRPNLHEQNNLSRQNCHRKIARVNAACQLIVDDIKEQLYPVPGGLFFDYLGRGLIRGGLYEGGAHKMPHNNSL